MAIPVKAPVIIIIAFYPGYSPRNPVFSVRSGKSVAITSYSKLVVIVCPGKLEVITAQFMTLVG
jgi:hypothetical protein